MKSLAILLAMILSLSARPGLSQTKLTPRQESTASRVFFDIMSPFCPGVPLNDCPSQPALELKEDIRGMVASGMKEDAIVELIVSRFGEKFRAKPAPRGVGLLVWVVPGFVFVCGLALLISWVTRKRA